MNTEKLRRYGVWLIVIAIIIVGLFSRLSEEEEKEKARKEDPSIVEKQKKDEKEKFNGEVTSYAVHVGYLSERNGNINTIITTYDSFKTYFNKYTNYTYDGKGNAASSSTDEITKKYNEDYFKEKSLAVVYIEESSGSISIESVKATVADETVRISIVEKRPEVGTMDMSGFFVIAEVPKTVTSISIE